MSGASGVAVRGSRWALAISLALVSLGAPWEGTTGPSTDGLSGLPDLHPWEAWFVAVGPSDEDPAVPALRFQTTTENRGTAPFEVIGVPSESDPTYPGWDPRTLDAYQCDSWALRGCLNYRPAGRLVFHESHGHWHLAGFLIYELRHLAANGQPDLASAPLAQSQNDSFCVMDNYFNESPSSDPANRHLRSYPACSLVRHGISPGWVDVDIPELPGQQIPLAGVPDGDYALVVRVDPGNKFIESVEDNNLSSLPIRLSGSQVTVIGGGVA